MTGERSDDDSGVSLGPVIVNLAGERVDASERDMLRHRNVGGVILFSRNYRSRSQLGSLCEEIRDVAQRPLLVCVDQEGGRVQRFREEFTRLPPPREFGRLFDADRERALSMARDAALTMALELVSLGVDLSFMPLADLDRGLCDAIGNRAFHRDPTVVHALCGAYIAGMREAGMAAVAKHFPGHGGVREDSHVQTPEDRRSAAQIEAEDLLPFARLIADGLEGVMTAHVRFPAVDADLPTFSRAWIAEILRRRLGFDGIVFSDDLTMAGADVAGTLIERARAALEAGCDALLVCNDVAATRDVVESLDAPTAVRSLGVLTRRATGARWAELERRVANSAPALRDLVDRATA